MICLDFSEFRRNFVRGAYLFIAVFDQKNSGFQVLRKLKSDFIAPKAIIEVDRIPDVGFNTELFILSPPPPSDASLDSDLVRTSSTRVVSRYRNVLLLVVAPKAMVFTSSRWAAS